jgi:diadenylate cyclase
LQNIFYPLTPLHDGGVVVNADKITAAACLFPLSDNPSLGKTVGTRHRAGLGLSENTDALVIIVSEENGAISLAINGQLTSDLSANELLVILKGQLNKGAE